MNMTLGLNFELFIVLPPSCYFRFVNYSFLAGSKALVDILRSTVSKRDLSNLPESMHREPIPWKHSKQTINHSGTFVSKMCMRPWIRMYLVLYLAPRRETKLLNLQGKQNIHSKQNGLKGSNTRP